MFRIAATAVVARALPAFWASPSWGFGFHRVKRNQLGRRILAPAGLALLLAIAATCPSPASAAAAGLSGAPSVIINYPGNGASIPERSALTLDGSTQRTTPVYDALPNASVSWQVRHLVSGLLLHSGTGHRRTVPAGVLIPGYYTVTFRGDPGGGGPIGAATVTIHVTDRAPQEDPPIAVIKRPDYSQEEYVVPPGASSVDVELWGLAGDAQDGPLDGTRMQWIAQSGKQRIVLCTGSRFPQPTGGLGSIGIYRDCSHVTVALEPPANAPTSNVWVLELRSVDDSSTVSDPVTRRIIVRHPPVP